MSRATRLQGVARFKQAQERKAAAQLGAANQGLVEQQQTLKVLNEHRSMYRTLLSDSHRSGTYATTWRQNLNFLGALDNAIDSQHANVALHQQNTQQARTHWSESHRKQQAVANLRSRLSQEEQLQHLSQENQQATENWVARQGGRANDE